MEKKQYLVLLGVAAAIFAVSLALFVWTKTADAATEQALTGSMALQLGYIVCAPLMVECAVFAAALSIVHFAKLHLGRVLKAILLVIGLLITFLAVAGAPLAAYMPEGLQILMVACVLVCAKYPLVMLIPGLALGFGVAPLREKAQA